MKDFFQEYRKSTLKKNVSIAAFAFVFALGVNSFLFGTDAGIRIQTSALQYAGGKTTPSADISVVSAGTGTDIVKLRVGRALSAVSEIRGTLLYDPSGLTVRDVFTTDANVEIARISNVEGVTLVNIRYHTPVNIPAGTEVATMAAVKTGSGRSVMNLAETQFVSSGSVYELSNEAVEFE